MNIINKIKEEHDFKRSVIECPPYKIRLLGGPEKILFLREEIIKTLTNLVNTNAAEILFDDDDVDLDVDLYEEEDSITEKYREIIEKDIEKKVHQNGREILNTLCYDCISSLGDKSPCERCDINLCRVLGIDSASYVSMIMEKEEGKNESNQRNR